MKLFETAINGNGKQWGWKFASGYEIGFGWTGESGTFRYLYKGPGNATALANPGLLEAGVLLGVKITGLRFFLNGWKMIEFGIR